MFSVTIHFDHDPGLQHERLLLITSDRQKAVDTARTAEQYGYDFRSLDHIIIEQVIENHPYRAGEMKKVMFVRRLCDRTWQEEWHDLKFKQKFEKPSEPVAAT